ncbi:MAG: HAMP domain-containing histidine kinase [Ktedonobacteraceae bacterium]|nr:HAMP domain-containing histidine kinase [Ktedonobacteraceae bacterium]
MRARQQSPHNENSPEPEETTHILQQRVDALLAENAQLKEQLARQERFLAMIAHDLRSPLTPIIIYAQKIAQQLPSLKGDEVKSRRSTLLQRYITIIVSQARRLSRLVNDLLDSSHLSTGQFALMRESCDIVALAKEAVENLQPLAPHHTLIVDAPETPITGNWDSIRLQQVLGNLLDNAIKYSDTRTTITVRIWTLPGKVCVSVHNEGVAIPRGESGQLFLPFTRLSAAQGHEGSGLGLYITKSIIDAHGGELQLESAADGDRSAQTPGTTFTFSLPL